MENIEDSFSSTSLVLESRHLLTYVGNQPFAFPSQWVTEIILIERSQILSLPFYSPLLLGIFHWQGMVIPTITGHLILSNKTNQDIQLMTPKETLSVIRLGESAEHLSGVGIVVDRVIEQYLESSIHDAERNDAERNDAERNDSRTELLTQPIIFQLADVPSHIWQPL